MRWITNPLLLSALVCPALAAHAKTMNPPPITATQISPKPKAQVEAVPSERVCMITNKVFAEVQIPITADGKTYYGCCDMCKERLGNDPASRQAIDPVTKATIDKAKAVIGADPQGNVVYFESLATLKAYNAAVTL